jgi:hypothetical protein
LVALSFVLISENHLKIHHIACDCISVKPTIRPKIVSIILESYNFYGCPKYSLPYTTYNTCLLKVNMLINKDISIFGEATNNLTIFKVSPNH